MEKKVLFVDTCIIEKKLCGLIYWLTSNLVVLGFFVNQMNVPLILS